MKISPSVMLVAGPYNPRTMHLDHRWAVSSVWVRNCPPPTSLPSGPT